VLSQALVRDQRRLGRTISLLYAINTLGAVVGTVLTGFVVLPWLGNRLTLTVAATANLVVGALAIASRRLRQADTTAQASEEPAAGDRQRGGEVSPLRVRVTVAALGVSGAVSMIYEIAWTRALALVIGSSTYAFTSMLVAFLVGITAGSALYGWLRGARRASTGAFAMLQIGIGLSVAAVVLVFERMPELFLAGLRWSDSPTFIQLVQFAVSASSLLLATLFVGATFPCAVAMAARGTERVGRDVGHVYAVNTLGAIVGSILAGFVLVPGVGVEASIKVGIAVNLLLAAVLFATSGSGPAPSRWGPAAAAGLAAVAMLWLPAWDRRVMSSGPAIYGQRLLKEAGRHSVRDTLRSGAPVIFYRDGISSTVSVSRGGGVTSLAVNGKADASTGDDMVTQLLLGHVPMLVHPDPKRVFVIGLGSGITAGAIARYPVEVVEVAELEPAVIEASRFFADTNGDVLRDPRVRVRLGDGRNLLLTARTGYDVIVSEPSNPWISGVASLFTVEMFRLARERLRPGGVMVQWVHLYSLRPADVAMIVRTFRTVFPDTEIWSGATGDVLLLGRTTRAPLDLRQIKRRFEANPAVGQDLGRIDITGWADVLSYFVLTERDAAEYSRGDTVNTDDRLPLEFSAPLALYLVTNTQNSHLLRRFRTARLPELSPESRAQLDGVELDNAVGLAHLRREGFEEALVHFNRALGLEPRNTSAQIGVGRASLGLDRDALALEFAQRALAREPAHPEALLLAGKALVRLFRAEEAIPLLERGLGLDPANRELAEALQNARRAARK
jgi:spermidine synthase